jgi:type II pantothenate kinase
MINIGVDSGGTLTKLFYGEKGHFHYKTFRSDELEKCVQWIKLLSPVATLNVTGGKAERWKNYFPDMNIIPEFDAIQKGVQFLMKKEKMQCDSYLLINIGTGTSFFKVENEQCERLLGSGIGGGAFLGLGVLLTGESNFYELVELAEKGNRKKVDLLVKDIYENDPSPVLDYLTAANFAKSVYKESNKEDKLRALSNMIAETIILLASQAVKNTPINTYIFVGSMLNGNKPFKQDLAQFNDLLGYDPIFLEHGSFAGSIGAWAIGNSAEK